ncbi:glucose-methanol-choline oxidoreductase, partial [Infundibulicybe gibba]
HHACCTNPMGPDNDNNAVLDGYFRVRGVSNLRVVDASSWPVVPGYFITTPTYMMSEKAADVII